MAEKVGNGPRLTFSSQLEVTGDNDIPNAFTTFCITDFVNLVFDLDNINLLDFDEDTGIFTFKRTGHLQVLATLNFAATGISEVQVSTAFKRGVLPWAFLNARRTELPIVGPNSSFLSGSVDIIKGDQLKFEVKAINLLAKFDTEILPNTSQIPAAVIDFILFIR